jgi:flagellar assembly protein FliH
MSAPVRFLFDHDFTRPPSTKAVDPDVPPDVPVEAHEAAVAKAEAAGYRRGEADGRRAAREADAARMASAMEALGLRLAETLVEAEKRATENERAAVALALAFAKKLSGAAVARFPLAEIEAAAEECFAELRLAPHVAVRVAPDFVEPVRAELTSIAQMRGFAGRLIVLGDPEIAEGDARLEWADGGVVRDASVVVAALDRAIEKRFGADVEGEAA